LKFTSFTGLLDFVKRKTLVLYGSFVSIVLLQPKFNYESNDQDVLQKCSETTHVCH